MYVGEVFALSVVAVIFSSAFSIVYLLVLFCDPATESFKERANWPVGIGTGAAFSIGMFFLLWVACFGPEEKDVVEISKYVYNIETIEKQSELGPYKVQQTTDGSYTMSKMWPEPEKIQYVVTYYQAKKNGLRLYNSPYAKHTIELKAEELPTIEAP